jgi:serine/threonine protein kinase
LKLEDEILSIEDEMVNDDEDLSIHIHSKLLDHINIVKFETMFQDNNQIFMVLNLCKSSLYEVNELISEN